MRSSAYVNSEASQIEDLKRDFDKFTLVTIAFLAHECGHLHCDGPEHQDHMQKKLDAEEKKVVEMVETAEKVGFKGRWVLTGFWNV